MEREVPLPAMDSQSSLPAESGRVPLSRYAVFFSIAIAGCAADLWTKSYLFGWLGMPGQRPPWWIIDEVFGFHTSLNEGALFGLGQGMVPVFAGMSVLAAIGIVLWLFYFRAARDWLLTVALGCITAGIFGNLYDRLGMPGLKWNYANRLHEVGEPVYAVRDWILVMIGDWPWPTFNIADSMLVCGAGMLMVHALFFANKEPNSAKPASAG